jgi:hypothetical protein
MKKLTIVVLLVALAVPVWSADSSDRPSKRVAVIAVSQMTQPFYLDPEKVAWVYYDDQLHLWTIRLSWAGTRIPTTMTRGEIFQQLGWRIEKDENSPADVQPER